MAGNGHRVSEISFEKGNHGFRDSVRDILPPGPYVVHADAVGEVAEKNQIYRARLQTPGPLQVAVGP